MKCRFNHISEFFGLLNDAGIKYLVLRNYENLLEPEMYVDGHGDVDMLCENALSVVSLVEPQSANPRVKTTQGDGIHYCIYVDGHRVTLDLREVGDGYYCKKWEQDLLDRREKHECFYVMNHEDYFYTLTYHAILQKRAFSDDYLNRLTEMSKRLSIASGNLNQQNFITMLEEHMRDHGYRFTYSRDHLVPNRFNLVDKSLVDFDFRLRMRHFWFELNVAVVEFLVKIKHSIQ